MKPLYFGMLIAALSSPVFANIELAQKKGCLMCHAIDKALIGPPYQAVAVKYTTADTDKLVQKVLKGGGGVWGTTRMPNNRDRGVSEDEARQLVNWILGLKPGADKK